RPRPDQIFEFGEPVHVELKLKARGEPVWADTHLDPSTHAVHFLIRRPNGQVVSFDPRMIRCVLPAPREINDRTPLYANVRLSVDRRGFTFLEPGQYQVRAILRSEHGLLLSNVQCVYVRYPTPEIEDAVVPALTNEVGAYLLGEGGPNLGSARHRLAALREQLRSSPAAHY